MREITSFAALADLRKSLLALPEVSTRIAQRGAEAFTALAQADFAGRHSPYGDPWGDGRDGKPLTLDKSGKLRAQAIRYVAQGRAIRCSLGVPYARYQLKHGLLPKAGKLPAAWNDALAKIANEELAKGMAV